MKLIKITPENSQYLLNTTELMLLRSLLRKLPFTPRSPASVSREDGDPQMVERKNY